MVFSRADERLLGELRLSASSPVSQNQLLDLEEKYRNFIDDGVEKLHNLAAVDSALKVTSRRWAVLFVAAAALMLVALVACQRAPLDSGYKSVALSHAFWFAFNHFVLGTAAMTNAIWWWTSRSLRSGVCVRLGWLAVACVCSVVCLSWYSVGFATRFYHHYQLGRRISFSELLQCWMLTCDVLICLSSLLLLWELKEASSTIAKFPSSFV